MVTGSMVALITPFQDDRVDEGTLKKLIDFQIENGTDVIVPCGTTGESATLSNEEHHQVIDITVAQVNKRVPVIAGTGSNSTTEAIAMTKAAKAAGADASLSVVPYYNKPTQEGVYRHYMTIAEKTDFPFVLYNIQGRTGINVLPETVARIAQACPLLVGVKEASGNLEQISRLHRLVGNKVAILSGDDALTLPVMAIGGDGVISVVANIAPRQTKALVQAWNDGRVQEALSLHEQLMPLVKALFLESNPGPVKKAASLMGLCGQALRLPMVEPSSSTVEILEKEMRQLGLL